MSIASYEPRAALAHIARTPIGWIIYTRGPYGARHFDCTTDGDAAELAIVLRDQGGWALRFSPSADAVRALVADLDGGADA